MRNKFDESSYNTIRVQTFLEKKTEKDFTDLQMVQDFQAHDSQIWVWEISHNNQYMATGWNSGYLKIWKLLTDLEDADDPYTLLEKEPFAVMPPTKTANWAILDWSWCQKVPNYIVTAHFDKKAVLWDINNAMTPLREFKHEDTVTWVQFHPDADDVECIFVTGCINKTYQVWNNKEEKSVCSQQSK